jgi:cell division protein FtsI (penicillin-binding protein 3)
VLGFVDIDNRGLAGMEYALDHGELGDHRADEPVALSVDLRIEEAVTSELRTAMRRFHPKGACGLVLDRVTGEILALSSMPDFDPNQADHAPADQRKNRCTGGTYELGSLFKVVSHAMALDSGKVRLTDRFDATQPLQIGRFRIRDDHPEHRWLSVPEIFMYSSNIGTARMAFAAGGADALKGFLRRVGLLEKEPLEIPEVASPQLPRRWADVTTATVSFGHGIAVTPLHYLDVVSGLVDDGTRITPTLLRRSPDNLPPRERLISAKTAQDLRFMLWLTVQDGTGTKAQVAGYMVGGKTGTADKAVAGGYAHNAVLASFVGVFPLEAPRYLVLVMLDQPTGDALTHGLRYGGWTAAPVVAAIIDRIGPILGVHRSPPAAVAAMRARMIAAKLGDDAPGLEKPGAAVVARD